MPAPRPISKVLERALVRRVDPEMLDELPADDPLAVRARRDLRRINAWMGNARLLARLVTEVMRDSPPVRIAELGGGDGTLLLNLARRVKPRWQGVSLELVDRRRVASEETIRGFEELGWRAGVVQCEVNEWLDEAAPMDLIVANLFVHHFACAQLRDLLEKISNKARCFVACEPRRFSFPGLAGRLVRLIGCHAITEHDAIASVRAGFVGKELSALWPEPGRWHLLEREAGLFSHAFGATRR